MTVAGELYYCNDMGKIVGGQLEGRRESEVGIPITYKSVSLKIIMTIKRNNDKIKKKRTTSLLQYQTF